jgi:hypothetical protein
VTGDRSDNALTSLSVVVTIVDAGEALERCLGALDTQQNAPPIEVIVPWDESVPGVPHVAARFPRFRFVPMGRLSSAQTGSGDPDQHELYDRRRSAGLSAATGDIVAILEDRGVPRREWARAILEAHARLPHAVIGGAVENGRDRMLNWAVYFCDFGRYQLPLTPGPRDWVTDVNVAYKRRALEQTRTLWEQRYHETTVHWALARAGETLYLTPDVVVDQIRGELEVPSLLGERFLWGRLFAYTRARGRPVANRVLLAALTPLLPALLYIRLARLQLAKRRTLAHFLVGSPVVLLLLSAWSLGETVGYLTGEPPA